MIMRLQHFGKTEYVGQYIKNFKKMKKFKIQYN